MSVVFKYMAGLVDEAEDEDEADFDPHQHRRIARPTSYMDTMIHLLKGSIGAGIMAMPDAFSRVGLICGIVSIIAIGIFATYCIQLLDICVTAQHTLEECAARVSQRAALRSVVGNDLSLPSVVRAMLESERSWEAAFSFCEDVLSQKEAAERVREEIAPPNSLRRRRPMRGRRQHNIATQYNLCKKWKRGYMGYPKSIRLAVQDGPKFLRRLDWFFSYFVEFVLVLWQIGICSIYLIFVAENIKQVCDFYGYEYSLRMFLAFQLLPQLLLNLIRSLKLLTPLSTISNILTSFAFILVFFYLIEDDLDIDEDKFVLKDFMGIPYFTGITLFALEAVGLICIVIPYYNVSVPEFALIKLSVLALEYNMEKPKHFVGLFGLFNIGMVIIVTLYTLIGVFGYLKYGNTVKASITLNLPQDQKKAQAAKVIFAAAIFLSFPLQNFVVYNLVWRRIEKKLTKNLCVVDYFLRILLVLIPWAMALIMPFLGPFISLFGAFCLSLLAIVFPGLMSSCYWYNMGYGCCFYKLFRDLFVIILGILIMLAGCYTSVLEITKEPMIL